MQKNITQLTKEYNHKLSQDLIKKAVENTEDWYSEEVKKSQTEFINWLVERKV